MSSHRKKPFSAKQKKQQLKEKREKKRDTTNSRIDNERRSADDAREKGDMPDDEDVRRINQQPLRVDDLKKGYDANRYRLHFLSESRKEIDRRKKLASQPYTMLPPSSLEIDMDDLYPSGKTLDIPKRPPWDYKLSKQTLYAKEEKYFHGYVSEIFTKYRPDELSYFELNLETWRQLWRVIEMSDILLMIVDLRFAALHFCPALYNYVNNVLKKHVICVLNKIDLAPPSLVVAWKHYLSTRYPDVKFVCFTSFPRDMTEDAAMKDKKGMAGKRKVRRYHAAGAMDLYQMCVDIVQDNVDLSSWREKIHDDATTGVFDDAVQVEHDDVIDQEQHSQDYSDYTLYKDGILTIGCVGYPNVGKSSLLNGLVGKKVVSISKTPGHTKHFQTIFLTDKVKLCDCPGLVFPSMVSRPLQILSGIYPVAQVREPYSTVEYLARHLPLPEMLKLRHPADDSAKHEEKRADLAWSAMDICYAWADQRGFTTAKIGRPDSYRAANHLLRLSIEARLCICTSPPNYNQNKAEWESHADTAVISALQTAACLKHQPSALVSDSDSDDLDLGDEEKESCHDGDDDDDDDESEDEAASATSRITTTRNPFALLGSDEEN